MSTPTARARAEQLRESLGIHTHGECPCDWLSQCDKKSQDLILAYADEIRREERVRMKAQLKNLPIMELHGADLIDLEDAIDVLVG